MLLLSSRLKIWSVFTNVAIASIRVLIAFYLNTSQSLFFNDDSGGTIVAIVALLDFVAHFAG